MNEKTDLPNSSSHWQPFEVLLVFPSFFHQEEWLENSLSITQKYNLIIIILSLSCPSLWQTQARCLSFAAFTEIPWQTVVTTTIWPISSLSTKLLTSCNLTKESREKWITQLWTWLLDSLATLSDDLRNENDFLGLDSPSVVMAWKAVLSD